MPLKTLVTHRQLRGHVAAYQCCGKSLIGSALVGFDVRQQAHIQHLTDVFHGQPAKEAHLDDLGLSRVDARQADQRLVERHEIRCGVLASGDGHHTFERHVLDTAAALTL